MKLHLLLSVSLLFHLSSGYMVELTGPLNAEETCTGGEFVDFKECAELGAAEAGLPDPDEIEGEAYVTHDHGSGRRLGICGGCPYGAPRGTFCYTWCGRGRRRLQEDGTDAPPPQDNVAIYSGNVYTGNLEAIEVAEAIVGCLESKAASHPCLGSAATMTLVVHTALSSADDLYKNSAGCVRGSRAL
jgi:hypothetical protein